MVLPSNQLILCCLLLLSSIFPSIRVFSNESVLCIRWPKYWSFSFSISPSNEYSGLSSFRMDWLDLLAVQGNLKNLQHHSSKASVLRCSTVQLSHPYITTGKTIALTRWTFVGKVMSLFFNMLSRLVITFLPKSKHLLISWLQSPFAVILEPKKIKSVTVSIVSPSICHEVMGPDAMILVFWMLSFTPTFSLSSFTFIKRLFSSSLFAIRVVSSVSEIKIPGIFLLSFSCSSFPFSFFCLCLSSRTPVIYLGCFVSLKCSGCVWTEFSGLLEMVLWGFSSYASSCRKFFTFLIPIETVLLLVSLISVRHAGCLHLSHGNSTLISWKELFRGRRWNENRGLVGGRGVRGVNSTSSLCL